MNKLKTFLQRQIRYPELLITWAISLFIVFQTSQGFFQAAFLVVFIISTFLFFITIKKRRDVTYDACVLLCFAITLGLLQFNYMASICLWLIFAYRLFLINRKNFFAPISIGFLAISFLIFYGLKIFQVSLKLSSINELYLNGLTALMTGIVFSHQMWYLILKIEYLTANANQSQERLYTMVERANKLTRFLPPQVWQPILKHNQPPYVTNQRRKLTILFSDIVGFTDLSDNISPDHLANILNTYIDRMTQITLKYGATLDKFIGDGMLCFFGDKADSNEQNDALRCVMMSIEMRREMEVLRRHWLTQGFEGLHIRIGINTGYCYVGNFGSGNRMTYTVIGKEANLAARLEASAKKDQILISENTFNLVNHKFACEGWGEIMLRGLQEPVKVWQVQDPQQSDGKPVQWVDYNLPGFNLHLNLEEIRNYDRRAIMSQLKSAMDVINKHQE